MQRIFHTPEGVRDIYGEECSRKKPEVALDGVRLTAFTEGLCVQMMHLGPYDAEECLQFRLIRLLHIEELLHERIWSLY